MREDLLCVPHERRNIVDLNYLFHRQQVERTRTECADSEAARSAHEQLAECYEQQIEALTGDDYQFPKGADGAR